MGSLLNNPNLKKDPLDRGEDIKPHKTFTTEDLQAAEVELKKKAKESKIDYKNIRVDNRAKLTGETLIALGFFKTQREAINGAFDAFKETLSEEEKKNFEFQYNTYLKRDEKLNGK